MNPTNIEREFAQFGQEQKVPNSLLGQTLWFDSPKLIQDVLPKEMLSKPLIVQILLWFISMAPSSN
jgi:hypothetical protein